MLLLLWLLRVVSIAIARHATVIVIISTVTETRQLALLVLLVVLPSPVALQRLELFLFPRQPGPNAAPACPRPPGTRLVAQMATYKGVSP